MQCLHYSQQQHLPTCLLSFLAFPPDQPVWLVDYILALVKYPFLFALLAASLYYCLSYSVHR